ncbi:MAG: SUMF1/EgtB/PvdO family nonheme iron enzyme [Desulfobacterales bacterium]|nr:SUMF1/EgtB/PvdO family nonheme iron enzyme [Desulfobacterales bacterium]
MSFQPSITLQGIEQAVQGLGYRNESGLKYRLIAAIKEMYGKNGEFTEPSHGIDSEELIRALWDVDPDPDSLRSRKKNLSSIKSSINADFKRLYREGRNPEGILIGAENLFTISDEAKDDLLAKIRTGETAAAEIRNIAGILNTMLSGGGLEGESHREEMGSDLQQVRTLLRTLSEKMGLSMDPSDTGGTPMQYGTDSPGQGEELKNPDAENGTDTGGALETAEPLGVGEGEFPDADPADLFEDEEELSEDAEFPDIADLPEVSSEGEVYETLEEIDEEEEEDPEVIDETEDFDEDMEFFGPEIVEDEGITHQAGETSGTSGNAAADEGERVPDDEVAPVEIQEHLLESGEEDALQEDDTGEELIDSLLGEEPTVGPEEVPVESEMEGCLDLEEIPEEEVNGVELKDDLGEVEEEEPAEEYDDAVLIDEARLDEESTAEFSQEEPVESAPVQGLSVGDEAGGTENTDKENARVLAEKFNNSLSEMDRLYNQYLLIAAGEYTIGSTNPKEKSNPARRVTLAEFYFGKFPVTNALFDVFVEKTGYRTTAERVGYGTVCYGRLQRRMDGKTGRESVVWSSTLTSRIVQGAFWYQPLGPGSNLHHKRNHPVVQISLEDAMAFAAWTGKRLPTEEEWEAASRTMKGSLYPWGNRFRKDACNVEKSGYGDTTAVDGFLEFQNEYGIADTMGNAMEWTTGKFEGRMGVQGSVSFIAKGGSWTTAKPINLASRADFGPDFHSNNLGFRCVAN